MNRAVHGDVVVMEIFDKNKWKAPADEVVDQDTTLKDDDAEISEGDIDDNGTDEVRAREMKVGHNEGRNSDKQPTGKVVGIIKRNWRAYVCHIDSTSLTSSNHSSLSLQTVFATPVSRLLPRIRLRTRQAPSLLNQKILVTIDRWDPTSRYPEGHFVRALGRVESKEAEQESLLLEFEVPYRPFGKAILDCLPEEGDSWAVPPKAEGAKVWQDREDLRSLNICSIDPPGKCQPFNIELSYSFYFSGCQDIDDALHARMLPNGNVETGVRMSLPLTTVLYLVSTTYLKDIADVSHFVHPDTAMDNEASTRGTTVYLVDKRIDMLPALLGTNLCSLRPYVERLAFSAIWVCSHLGQYSFQ